jgi:hypothetical protein
MTINNFHDEYINTRNFYPFNLTENPSEDDIIKMDHIKNIYDNFYDEIFTETKKNLYYEISENIYQLISKDIHERYNINYSYNIDTYMHGFEHYTNLEDETEEIESHEEDGVTEEIESHEDEENGVTEEIESHEENGVTEEIESHEEEDEIEYTVSDVNLNEDDAEYEYEVHDLEDSEYLKAKNNEF